MMQARFHKLNLKLRNEENKKSFSFFFSIKTNQNVFLNEDSLIQALVPAPQSVFLPL